MAVIVYIWYPLGSFNSSSLSAFLLRDVGHVSIEINGVYISHRPIERQNGYSRNVDATEYAIQLLTEQFNYNYVNNTREYSKKKYHNKDTTKKYLGFNSVPNAHSSDFSYEKECKRKGREANRCISLLGFDEEKMLEYYSRHFKDKYHPLQNNCCTFVTNIIRSSLSCSLYEKCYFCEPIDKSVPIKIIDFLKKNYLLLNYSKVLHFLFRTIFPFPFIPPFLSSIFCLIPFLTRYFIFPPVWTPILVEKFIDYLNQNKVNNCFRCLSN